MENNDKWLTCTECGRQFLWDAGEQTWYQGKNFKNTPRRCKNCRDNRRQDQKTKPRQSSQVRCAQCGTMTVVPFVPIGTKPVYCRSCMAQMREAIFDFV